MFNLEAAEIERAQVILGRGSNSTLPALSDRPRAIWLWLENDWLEQLFFYAGLSKSSSRRLLSKVALASWVVLVVTVLIGQFYLIPLCILPALFAFYSLKKRARRRAEVFEKDYTAFVLSLASAVRTGLDPLMALIEARHLFPKGSQILQHLTDLQEQIEQGRSEEQVVNSFAASIQHPDLPLFRTAFILARKEGASLAECLRRLARVTRQRQSFRRKVKGAVAMQKLSSFGIAGCTIVIGLIQFVTNPVALLGALQQPVGIKLLVGGVSLVVIGLLWMLQLAKPQV